MTTAHRIAAAALGTVASLGVAVQAGAAAPVTAVEAHHQHTPAVVRQWLAAWNSADGPRLGALFTADGRYTDHAFGATFTGPDGVAQWVANTGASIDDVHGTLRWAHRHGDVIVFGWTFTGHLKGAPSAFEVPATTVLHLDGSKIATDDDLYSRAEILADSRLPADWQPGS